MEKSICFCPDKLSVYGESDHKIVPALTEEEILINSWLDEKGVTMADPLDLIYGYFEKKKSLIRQNVDKKKPSNLWERRKEKTKTFQSPILSKSSQSSDDGSNGFFE
ncbi:hypothetical protein ABPG72_009935 [Tetrahymena utriculariae]